MQGEGQPAASDSQGCAKKDWDSWSWAFILLLDWFDDCTQCKIFTHGGRTVIAEENLIVAEVFMLLWGFRAKYRGGNFDTQLP